MSVLAEEKPLNLRASDEQTAEARAIVYSSVEINNRVGSENKGSPMTQGGSTGDVGTNGSLDEEVERAPARIAMVTQRSRKKTKAGRYTSDITYEEMEKYFHLPGEKAAKELGVGLTILKRLCRKFGLARWPYKKPTKKAVEMERMRLLQEYSDMVDGVHGPAWMNPGGMHHVQGPVYGTQGTWQPNVFPHAAPPVHAPSFGYLHEPRIFQPVPNRASSDNRRWNLVLERLGILPDEKSYFDSVSQGQPCRGFIPLKTESSLRKPIQEKYFDMAARNNDPQYSQDKDENTINPLSPHAQIDAILNARAAANSGFKRSSPIKERATAQKPSEQISHQQLEEKIRMVAQDPALCDTIKHLLEALYAQAKNESQAN